MEIREHKNKHEIKKKSKKMIKENFELKST